MRHLTTTLRSNSKNQLIFGSSRFFFCFMDCPRGMIPRRIRGNYFKIGTLSVLIKLCFVPAFTKKYLPRQTFFLPLTQYALKQFECAPLFAAHYEKSYSPCLFFNIVDKTFHAIILRPTSIHLFFRL